jgi:hypothetical protein
MLIIDADALLRAYSDLPAQTFAKPVLPAKTVAEANEEEWCCDF